MHSYSDIDDVMVEIEFYIKSQLTAGVFVRYNIHPPVISIDFRDMEATGSQWKQLLLCSESTLAVTNKHGIKKVSSCIIVDIVYHLSKDCWLVN